MSKIKLLENRLPSGLFPFCRIRFRAKLNNRCIQNVRFKSMSFWWFFRPSRIFQWYLVVLQPVLILRRPHSFKNLIILSDLPETLSTSARKERPIVFKQSQANFHRSLITEVEFCKQGMFWNHSLKSIECFTNIFVANIDLAREMISNCQRPGYYNSYLPENITAHQYRRLQVAYNNPSLQQLRDIFEVDLVENPSTFERLRKRD